MQVYSKSSVLAMELLQSRTNLAKYRKVSNTRRTQSQNLNASRLIL